MTLTEIILLALSLSADSFVVSMGGSVTLGRVRPWKIVQVAMIFGTVQAACLFAGWISGYSVVSYVSRLAPYLALAVLGYLGISMIAAGVKGSSKAVDLNGLRNLILAAVATSVDAIAVGISLAMGEMEWPDAVLVSILTLAVTVCASSVGIVLGSASGRVFGNAARIAGGAVLVFIGLRPFIF